MGAKRLFEQSGGIPRPVRLAALVLLACAGAPLRAHASGIPVCVSSNTELRNALASAEFLPTTIEIVQGNYDLRGSAWSVGGIEDATIQAGGELLGGFTPGCAGRNIEVGNTVLADSDPHAALDGVSLLGDFTIEGLTVSIPGGLTLWAADNDVPAGTTILVRRDAFINADAGNLWIDWAQDDDVGGTIRVVDTLIAGNTGIDVVGLGCSLMIETDSGTPAVQLVHDTIVDNAGSGTISAGACVLNNRLGDHASATLAAYNNIFYGNGARDLTTDADVLAPALVDNVIGPHHTPGALELGTQSANPHLDGDYRPIESPPSEVINTGSTTAPGGLPDKDLPGRDRVIGTAPDRGAFESAVDDSFLQTVSSTSDAGVGSLRAAILGANAHGSGLISFDVGSGCGPHVITLDSPLPAVTVPLIINGNTQTGASANDLDFGSDATFCIILEAGNSAVTKALQIPTSASDTVSMRIEGLAFSGFSEAAIALGAGSGSVVIGNRFGGSVGGHALQPNGAGIRLDANSHDAIIGGDDVADRNIIGGSSGGSGIDMFGSLSGGNPVGTNHNQVVNNMIGVGWSGDATGHFTNLANSARGIYLAGHHNTISGNWIGDNAQAGIAIVNGGAQHNTITGNYIGFPWGTGFYGNGQAGIHVQGDAGDAPTINVITDNVLAENGTQGVWVEIGQRNKIRQNGIYANGGLGIDLVDAGVLPNDTDAGSHPADYANRGQNYPVLDTAIGGASGGHFVGSLESTLGNYRIDFYQTPGGCDPGDNRQGQAWVASLTVSITIAAIGGDGDAAIDANLQASGYFGGLVPGAGITATATDSDGNTSEFSACIPYQDDTIFANGFD